MCSALMAGSRNIKSKISDLQSKHTSNSIYDVRKFNLNGKHPIPSNRKWSSWIGNDATNRGEPVNIMLKQKMPSTSIILRDRLNEQRESIERQNEARARVECFRSTQIIRSQLVALSIVNEEVNKSRGGCDMTWVREARRDPYPAIAYTS